MTVGYAVSATDVNNRAGLLVTTLWNTLQDLKNFKAWLDDGAHTDTFLNNLPGGGISGSSSSGDVKTLRDSIADLGSPTVGLYAVSHGIYVPGGTNNFFFNAKLLAGVNYAG